MTTLADARTAVTAALDAIGQQIDAEPEGSEQSKALLRHQDELLDDLQGIELAILDQAAGQVAAAAAGLQAVIDDTKLDTLSQLKQKLAALKDQLDGHHTDLVSATKLAKATVPGEAAAPAVPASAPPTAASNPAVSPGQPPAAGFKPINAKDFNSLKAEYLDMFERCSIIPAKTQIIQGQLGKLLAGKDRYKGIASDTPGMPWYFVGIIHGMEAGYRFNGHLHNGDPLTARTVNVPAGRPPLGHPPFTWEESARDALTFEALTAETDFSIARILYFFEKYNGFGYRAHGIPSPYLWGYSTWYSGGKFVADHLFSRTAVSDQAGAAVVLKALQAVGEPVA